MTADLSTTNVLLGIMAAVSLLEALVLLACLSAVIVLVRRLLTLLEGIESRQIAPAAARVNAILDDVRQVTTSVKTGVDHVGGSLGWISRMISRYARPRA